MNSESMSSEIAGIAVTSLRLGIAEHMARRVSHGVSIANDMAVFVASDILDGVVLRKHDMDTPIRRVADGVVDHLSVYRVMVEVAQKNPHSRPYIGILATRGVLVGGLNVLHLAQTGEVTKGRHKQKATNLATAVFGVAAASGNKPLTHVTGLLASTIAVITAPHHLHEIGKRHDGEYREL